MSWVSELEEHQIISMRKSYRVKLKIWIDSELFVHWKQIRGQLADILRTYNIQRRNEAYSYAILKNIKNERKKKKNIWKYYISGNNVYIVFEMKECANAICITICNNVIANNTTVQSIPI